MWRRWCWPQCWLVSANVGPAAAAYPDVKSTDWFAKAVDELSAKKVITGGSDGNFRPYETVTRAQFSAMLARAVQPPAATTEPFTDVSSSDWFYSAVASLNQAGLIEGSGSKFNPGTGLSRQQAATLVMRAVAYKQKGAQPPVVDLTLTPELVTAWLGAFHDRWFIADAHRTGIANALRFNVIKGYADDRFYPFFTLTRAQAAGMLYQALYVPLVAKTTSPASVAAEGAYPPMKVGSTGPLVQWLEQHLRDLRYVPGAVDGTYDERTRHAVQGFQKVEGLTRDGSAGQQVLGRIIAAGIPRPRLSAAGARAEIDLTRQVLFIISNNQVIKTLAVSTGTTGWRTPPGHFRIQRKIPAWRQSSLGFLYKPAYFNGGIAIHGSYSVPPYAASHGCVRVPVWAMDALYYQLPVGMPVDVYYR